MSLSQESRPPLRDRIIPWYFVMAFMVIFAVNGYFVYMATNTLPALVTENAFEKGLAHDETLARKRVQDALGWRHRLEIGSAMVKFSLQDKTQTPLSNAKVVATITRPVGQMEPIQFILSEGDDGSYAARFSFPEQGQWDIEVNALWNQHPYTITQRVVIK